jgi:hypothetical protein
MAGLVPAIHAFTTGRKTWMPGSSPGMTQKIRSVQRKSHRPDFDHVGHEMPEQVLDAVLQRRGG